MTRGWKELCAPTMGVSMSGQKVFSNRPMAWTAVVGLAVFLAAIPAVAEDRSGDYLFLIGSGFLCDSGDSSACPAVVKSADDSTYELSGAGTLSAQSKSVTAVGTFTRRSPNGNSLETGIWIANELVSFDSYGAAPYALMREGWVFGAARFGPRRTPMLSGPRPTGGLAVFRIQLLPMSGLSRTAVLQVNCALGKVPDERQTEGVRLSFERGGGEFDQEISGRTMFVLTRLGASPAPKASATGDETSPAPPEVRQ